MVRTQDVWLKALLDLFVFCVESCLLIGNFKKTNCTFDELLYDEMCARARTHMRACLDTYIHTYIHTHTYIQTDRQTHKHEYIHTYMHACIHVYKHTYIQTYIHTYT